MLEKQAGSPSPSLLRNATSPKGEARNVEIKLQEEPTGALPGEGVPGEVSGYGTGKA